MGDTIQITTTNQIDSNSIENNQTTKELSAISTTLKPFTHQVRQSTFIRIKETDIEERFGFRI